MPGDSNKLLASHAKEALDKLKIESAREVGVDLEEGYNGDLTTGEVGSVGGNMVKKMLKAYEENSK